MNETELRVVCKSCGAEVSPYVTECPYCGARVRKRAPKLERRDGGLEAKKTRKERRREKQASRTARFEGRPVVSIALILIPAIALIVRIASGGDLEAFGAVVAPVESGWWRFLTAQFAYLSVGYLFVVALALAIFGPALESRLGRVPAAILLVASGALGTVAAWAIGEQAGTLTVIAGGNGMALGAIWAWTVIRAAETADDDEGLDRIGLVVASAVVLLLPVVVDSADFWTGLAGGLVGLIAGLVAVRFRR
jgi:membrane associated rhomboid family serine protease